MKSQKKFLTLCALSVIASACAEVNPPKNCDYNMDCDADEVCSEHICIQDPCRDGVLSPNESDVDCGHVCSAKCNVDQRCEIDADCKYNTCKDGVCINPEQGCVAAEPGDLLITEILNNISSGKKFEAYGVQSLQTEFIEIYNKSSNRIALSPISVRCTRVDDGSDKSMTFSMNGCIEPKNAAVVSNIAIEDLPEGVLNIQSIPEAGVLVNTASYKCELVQRELDEHGDASFSTLHIVSVDAQAKAGVSETLEPLAYSSSARALTLHTDASISEKFPAGTKHSPGYCTNGALYRNDCDTLCSNQQLDPGETDIDCGGLLCNSCAADQKCTQDSDCLSDSCINGICEYRSCSITGCPVGQECDAASGKCHSCSDGIQNGDETDVDCGGLVCGRCLEGKACSVNNDCESFVCDNLVCVGNKIDCQTPEPGDLVITEILNYASSNGTMATYDKDADQKQVEFIELVNLSGKYISLDGLTVQFKRLNGTDGNQKIELNSCIAPHQASVISGTPLAGLPDNVSNIVVASFVSNKFNNKAIYEVSLLQDQKLLHISHDEEVPVAGVSHVLPEFGYSSGDTSLVNHNALNSSLKHSPGYCTNGALFVDGCEILCENEKLDAGETDIDCGGPCAKCGAGKSCHIDSDCASGVCTNAVCEAPKCSDDSSCPNGWCNGTTGLCESCSDNVKNGTETDVDCGGDVCAPCDANKVCQTNVDCLSYECQSFVCVGDPVDSFKSGELIINEIMGSPRPSQFFSTQPETNQCEFIEIVSLASVRRNLNGWSIAFRKSETGDTPVEIPIFNILEPKHGIVVHNCSTLPLPQDMREQVYTKTKEIFANTSDYDVWLTNGSDKSEVVVRKGLAANGKSQTRQKDLDPASDLVYHDVVSHRNYNSPGYCANGGLFSENCITTCENNQLDTGETDIDCGGSVCEPCENDKKCAEPSDCVSGYCSAAKLCETAPCTKNSDCGANWTCDVSSGKCISCMDNVKNGDETDVDCGGSCNACAVGKSCAAHSDCETGLCSNNKCQTTSAAAADPDKLIINEIFDSGARSPAFPLNEDVTACEFIEIANPTSDDMNLLGMQLVLTGTSASNVEQTPLKINLSGILKSKNLLVVNNCTELPLPSDAVSLTVSNAKMLTGTWSYKAELVTASKTSLQFEGHAIGSVVNSSFNRNPDMTAGAALEKTTNIAEYAAFATPGYCLNGGLYSEGCKPMCENGRKDNGESDVDCGGPCAKCQNGKSCTKNEDCATDECTGGVCTGVVIPAAEPDNLLINEVMVAEDVTASSKSFFTYNDNGAECKFVEVVNISGKSVKIDGCSIILKRTDVENKVSTTALSGTLASRGVLVASYCDTAKVPNGIALPAGTLEARLGNTGNITQTGTYDAYIKCGESDGTHIAVAKAEKGTSMNRSVDGSAFSSLILHSEVASNTAKVVASPGYCANGGLFSSGCN